MATLKEFEEALREHGMVNALAILDGLKKRDREKRSIAPARRIVGRKMTAELARTVVEMHATTGMTQQEIAFKLGVNQGRVNEVIKRGKWLNGDPTAPEALSRDKAMTRLDQRAKSRRGTSPGHAGVATQAVPASSAAAPAPSKPAPRGSAPRTPASTPVPSKPTEAELPLSEPETARPVPSQVSVRSGARRHVEPISPIVSAQLAFLDL